MNSEFKHSYENVMFGFLNEKSKAFKKENRFRMFLALVNYYRVCRCYKKNGFSRTLSIIKGIVSKNRKKEFTSQEEQMRLASNAMFYMGILSRLMGESNLCLPKSLSLFAGLRTLNINASLVVGKCKYQFFFEREFHSWIEINDHSLYWILSPKGIFDIVMVLPKDLQHKT